MAIDAHDLQPGKRSGMLVHRQRTLVRDAKLIAFEAGGNIGVGLGVHIWVDTDADGRARAHLQRHRIEHVYFGLAFDVEATNTGSHSPAHLVARFAHARKNHLGHIPTRSLHPCQFAR